MELISRADVDAIFLGTRGTDETIGLYESICDLPNVKAIPLDRIKEAREKIENKSTYDGIYIDRADVLKILDKLIECGED